MEHTTTYQEQEKFHDAIKSIMKDIYAKYSGSKFILTDDFYRIENNSLHFLAKLLQNKTPEERILFRLLSKVILQSESLSGGSAVPGFLFAFFFLERLLLTENNYQDTALEKEFSSNILQLKQEIEKNMSLCKKEDISRFIKSVCDNKVFAEVLELAIEVAGLEGKLYLEDGKQLAYVIEKTQGYNFVVSPLKMFLTNNTWESVDVKVLLVDGIIERVSEIDRILSRAFETKEPVLFIAKGFSEEVIGTLKANFDRGNLNIVPALINENIENINIMADLASVTGSSVVSAFKGDILSFVNIDEIPTVSKVKCQLGQITIEESKTKNRVSKHLQNLLIKRVENQNVYDIVDIIDKRIKSLTASTTTIRLPQMDDLTAQTLRAQTDISLRGVKSILNNGLVRLEDVSKSLETREKSDTFITTAFRHALQEVAKIFPSKLSTLSVYLGILMLSKQVLMIYMAKGAVISTEG